MTEIGVSDRLKQNYDDYYRSDEAEWRRLGAIDKAANIIRLCGSVPHRSIIEIGAGEGAILARLAELGFGDELYAVEISASGVESIERRCIPGLVESRLFDGSRVPYGDQRFDVAVMSHVLEHVEHPRQLLYEAARVARFVFIEVPLEDISRMPRDFVFDRVGHINHYSARTVRWLMQSSGLRVLQQLVTNPSKATYRYGGGSAALVNFYVKELLLRMLPGTAMRHFSYHCSLLCEADHG